MQAIIFDMDGTLLDSETLWSRAPLVMLEHFGVEVDESNAPWISTSFRKTLRNYLESPDCWLDKTFEECEAWCLQYMYGIVYPQGIARMKPHAIETLEAMQRLLVPMCLLSATSLEAVETTLKLTGMIKYFRFYASTQDAAVSKHRTTVFEQAAHRLGCAASECLVIEDSLYAMRTAREAGCAVWAIEDPKHVADLPEIRQVAERYFNDHIQLRAALEAAFAPGGWQSPEQKAGAGPLSANQAP